MVQAAPIRLQYLSAWLLDAADIETGGDQAGSCLLQAVLVEVRE